MIRLLLDQGLPRGTALHLRKARWDVVHVGEIGMSRATDQEILDYPRREDRVCVTLDADWGSGFSGVVGLASGIRGNDHGMGEQ